MLYKIKYIFHIGLCNNTQDVIINADILFAFIFIKGGLPCPESSTEQQIPEFFPLS